MKSNNNKEKKIIKAYEQAAPYLGLGVQLVAAILLMLFLGKWLDGKLKTYPLLTVIFSLFGGFAGIYNLVKTVMYYNKKNE